MASSFSTGENITAVIFFVKFQAEKVMKITDISVQISAKGESSDNAALIYPVAK